jgi:uncharacterized protein (TIGR00255 family)
VFPYQKYEKRYRHSRLLFFIFARIILPAMIKSMTGYGKEVVEYAGKMIHLELRCLNSKQTDLNLKTSPQYREKDLELRAMLIEKLERGKIDLAIYIENAPDNGSYSLNKPLAVAYFRELKSLASEIGEQDFTPYLPLLTRMPDVLQTHRQDLDPREWERIREAIIRVIGQADLFRIQEGNVLKADITGRIRLIQDYLGKVTAFEEQRIKAIREWLNKSLLDLVDENRIDPSRLEQELIFYLDKIDITEEKVRIQKHCDYFLETMEEDGNTGKKLSFITQEIGREINTLGAKSNEVNIQKLVVQMKDELEKIKEQLSNVL